MKRTFITCLFCLCGVLCAQRDRFAVAEKQIAALSDTASKSMDVPFKTRCNDSILRIFNAVLADSRSFAYPFADLKYIGCLYAPDSAFRLINWNLACPDGSVSYSCILQTARGPRGTCGVYAFRSTDTLSTNRSGFKKYTDCEWYGALYYAILSQTINHKTCYVLLGTDLNDDYSNRKLIESLYFDESGSPVLGMPVFAMGGKMYNRIVFEYTERAAFVLHFDQTLNMIVFDHLAATNPLQDGNYRYYAPTGLYDGFLSDGKVWTFIPSVNVKNKKIKKKKHSTVIRISTVPAKKS